MNRIYHGAKSGGEATADDPPKWSCSFTGYLRLMAGAYGEAKNEDEAKPGLLNFAYAVMYIIMVIYTVVFTFMYIRRVLYMAFLTMVAPLIALTYPLDKLKDGKAQALGMWLREYIFNALMQPLHLIIYLMVISNVMSYVTDHPVYALVAIGFLLPAEKFFRKMFGFEKADTFDDGVANTVGGAAIMSGVSKLSSLGSSDQDQEDSDSGNVRTADNNPTTGDDSSSSGQPTQQQNNNDLKSQIASSYRALKAQGLSDDEIAQQLNSQYGNSKLVNEVMQENATPRINNPPPENSQQGGGQQGGGQTASNARLPQMNAPQITGARTPNNTERGFGSRVMSGLMNVGYERKKKAMKSKPLKTIGRFTGMALGGAALGILGLAAGIATGEFDNTLKFTASGIGIGGSLGGSWGASLGNSIHKNAENFKKGYYGDEEYNNRQYDERFMASKELRGMINDSDIHSEMHGGFTSEVKRARAIAAEAHEYHRVGITDAEQISMCMKSGLTPEEGIYAIELAKAMKKEKVKTKTQRDSYRQKYEAAFQNQNTSKEKGQKINDIWDTASRIRFN